MRRHYLCPSHCPILLFSCLVMSNSLQPHGLQHTRLLCPSLSPGACPNSCSSSQWCHSTISSSAAPFSSCLQSFPASGSFQMSSSSYRVAKVLEFQLQYQSFQWIFRTDFLQDWLVWLLAVQGTLKSLLHTTVQKHQFFGTQPSSQSNSHIHTWPLEKP